jgi:hypothetical protein
MTLANVQGKLSRAEMKKVMAGDASLDIPSDGECVKKDGRCVNHSDCCANLVCTNTDGENGKARCH